MQRMGPKTEMCVIMQTCIIENVFYCVKDPLIVLFPLVWTLMTCLC